MSPGQCSNPGWWMISSKIILPNILRIMRIIRIQQEIPFLTNHSTGMTFGMLKTCFSTSQMVWRTAECFETWPTIGTAHDPTWRSFPLMAGFPITEWMGEFFGENHQPTSRWYLLCSKIDHVITSTMIYLDHPGSTMKLKSRRRSRFGVAPGIRSRWRRWVVFGWTAQSCFTLVAVFFERSSQRMWNSVSFPFQPIQVYESMKYCGWLRNPNHQLFGGLSHYL